MTQQRVYFPGLNGLRFLAASIVIIHHLEQYKSWMRLPNLWGNAIIDAIGHQAVSIFFVLSGFLITYLLLVEQDKYDTISIRKFYMRRILRIWPLYFLIVLLCFLLPHMIDTSLFVEYQYSKLLMTGFFLLLIMPNVVRIINGGLMGGNQMWSIGVEEQFYIIWPLLIKRFVRQIPMFLGIFIGLKFLVSLGLYLLKLQNPGAKNITNLFRFWEMLQVEQMAIGAIGAWFLFQKREAILKVIYSPVVQWGSIVATLAFCIFDFEGLVVSYLEACVYTVFILNLSTNPTFVIRLENKFLSYVGNFSYSIYMYHTLCITICLSVLYHWYASLGNFGFNIALYISSYTLTLGVSWLSYNYFEKPFLRIKEHFMKVESTPSALGD